MELSASKIPRIEVVDALRGFAVMAIIFPCLQEKLMLFSLFCSGLHSISNVIIRQRKEKTSATASYGDWFCCLASQP